MDLSKQFSPRSSARLAGLIYLIVISGGGFAEAFVRQRLLAPGDAHATAAAIRANEPLMRLAFAADMIPLLLNMLLAAILYQLFKAVSERGALTAVFFVLASSAVQAAAMAFHFASLVVLGASPALSAFDAAQLEQLSYLFLRLHAHAYTIALLFFGGGALTIGFLLLGSKFMPRLLGLLMCLAGLCYLTNSMLYFVAPEFASIAILLPALLGEGGLTLWFLIVGVNAAAWRKQAGLEA
ncbi:MAG TPA: DUF4386 domain-containing protein [Parvularcula sp.]|jgi:hypothetical protein|nr:DUF4386 domain-containing protein [Parvularcula sp.]